MQKMIPTHPRREKVMHMLLHVREVERMILVLNTRLAKSDIIGWCMVVISSVYYIHILIFSIHFMHISFVVFQLQSDSEL